MKDNFSKQAAVYAQFRPTYPPELFNYIVSFVKEKNEAWDCGTGNGQSAKELSKYFTKVIATDISQKQIDNSHKEENIFYSIAPAEQTTIADNSIDLVTVSQALHWFKFDQFYKEVKRVGKPGGIIAVWSYSLLRISPQIDSIIEDYHYKTLDGFWEEERKYVDDNYATIPFERIEAPQTEIKVSWSLPQLEGYFNTWSALQKYLSVNEQSPVDNLMEQIRPLWGEHEERTIIFPVHLKMGIIK
jgi:SAM-dependent methyltransferase